MTETVKVVARTSFLVGAAVVHRGDQIEVTRSEAKDLAANGLVEEAVAPPAADKAEAEPRKGKKAS